MKTLVAAAGFAALAAMSAPALAQDNSLPLCSATVRDKCMQPARAQAMAADTYKGGGKDNSAMMGASSGHHSAKAHHRMAHKRTKTVKKTTTTTTPAKADSAAQPM
ncbi:MAG: hypothetical protein RQ833_04870 [Sphingomonadaceae bacterium]|nr:hypothetical protein [Sphingomonadaceae bacterium]